MKDLFPTKKSFFAAIDLLDDSDNQDEEDKSWGSLLTFADKEPEKPKPNIIALSSERNPPRADSDTISSCDLQSEKQSARCLQTCSCEPPLDDWNYAYHQERRASSKEKKDQ
jgi:hypothetical protein